MADSLQIRQLAGELKALKNQRAGRTVPDLKLDKRIAEIESEIGRRSEGSVTAPTAMRKGGSVIKKSGSKAAKAGVTKFSPVKTKKMAEGGLTKKQTAKVGKVMGEFKDKTLHSGKGGKVVTNPKQAIAIGLSQAGLTKPKKKTT